MSKQANARLQQRYRTDADTCANCAFFKRALELPAWMKDENARRQAAGRSAEYGDEHRREKNLRCSLGGFAVKKTAVCEQHKHTEA